jgi:hypothetical protein
LAVYRFLPNLREADTAAHPHGQMESGKELRVRHPQ